MRPFICNQDFNINLRKSIKTLLHNGVRSLFQNNDDKYNIVGAFLS